MCSEQENAYHGDSRSGVPRAGHCASAVPSLGHQAGLGFYGGFGLYNALGHAFVTPLLVSPLDLRH